MFILFILINIYFCLCGLFECFCLHLMNYWSAGPIRPSDQSDAIVAGFLSIYLSVCLVVGFRPRFHSVWSRPLCNCLVKKINQGTDVLTHKHTELPASSFSIMCSQACMYEIIILTGSKNNNMIKIAESGQVAVGSWHPPLGLQTYFYHF